MLQLRGELFCTFDLGDPGTFFQIDSYSAFVNYIMWFFMQVVLIIISKRYLSSRWYFSRLVQVCIQCGIFVCSCVDRLDRKLWFHGWFLQFSALQASAWNSVPTFDFIDMPKLHVNVNLILYTCFRWSLWTRLAELHHGPNIRFRLIKRVKDRADAGQTKAPQTSQCYQQ